MSTDIVVDEATFGPVVNLPGEVHSAALPPVIFLRMSRKKPLPAPMDASFEAYWHTLPVGEVAS